MRNKWQLSKLIALLCILTFILGHSRAVAQSGEIEWGPVLNISNSEGKTSTDPFLLADPSGVVHLFWGEKISNSIGNQPDTLMHTSWDGNSWSAPVDLFFAPDSGNPIIAYPRAVLDADGWIHLIWLEQPNFPNYALFYSSVHASKVSQVQAWTPKVTLAEDLTGTKYSADIAITQDGTLHILYARVPQGENPPERRAATYIQSSDGGLTWSDPRDIYTIPELDHGVSDTRLLAAESNRLYATWTEWDDTGNGLYIVFTSSLDNGVTWSPPKPLAKRLPGEYERDWNNLTYLGDDKLVVIWEGGYRAYRHAMYSDDGGDTWSEPVDVFPWLIGDNGSVEFAWDSSNTLHVFVAQRVREGFLNRSGELGLWHSVWEGGTHWREPVLATPGGAENITNPKVAIVNGNKIVAVWYGSQIYEIMAMTGIIRSAEPIRAKPWSISTRNTTQDLLPEPTPIVATPEKQNSSNSVPELPEIQEVATIAPNPGSMILFGSLLSTIVVGLIFSFKKFLGRGR